MLFSFDYPNVLASTNNQQRKSSFKNVTLSLQGSLEPHLAGEVHMLSWSRQISYITGSITHLEFSMYHTIPSPSPATYD